MGDLTGGGDVDEAPVRTVTFAQPFAVARYETTFAQWDACVAAGECRSGVRDIGFGRGDRPVILVTWKDAKAYTAWLSRISGKQFRLPTEAEWEYVARAGSETRYPWGDAIGRGNANCDECGSSWDDERTAPAGSFPANAFGVHDAVGNVYEWVDDCGRADYAGAPADGSVWEPDGACAWRMMRGGSWLSLPRASRPANRVRVPDVLPGHQRRLPRRKKPVLKALPPMALRAGAGCGCGRSGVRWSPAKVGRAVSPTGSPRIRAASARRVRAAEP